MEKNIKAKKSQGSHTSLVDMEKAYKPNNHKKHTSLLDMEKAYKPNNHKESIRV